ncbi:MAG TPA: hypothetical protein VIL34_24025 [Actinopolymorphaceae bacterium]|jgi:hypothetical protein
MSIDPTVKWLLHSDEPAIRFLTRREILGEPAASAHPRSTVWRISARPSGETLSRSVLDWG